MTADDHRSIRADLGAFALGQLPPDDARRVEEHLAWCGSCRAQHEELLPAAGALRDLRGSLGDRTGDRAGGAARTPPDRAAAPPPELGDRVVTAVRAAARTERRRSLLRSAALLSAGAAAASAVLAATVGFGGEDPPAPVPLEAVEVDPRVAGIDAEADLVAHTWGVEVKLTASGFDRGDRFRVVVVGDDGRDYPAGGFVGTGMVEMHCNLNSTVLRDSASGFEVRDAEGQVVAASRFAVT